MSRIENRYPAQAVDYQPLDSPEILLVLPPLYQTGREPDYNPKEPMGLMYLAASLRRDYRNVHILDADIEAQTIAQTSQYILEKNPPIVGFSVFQRALPSFELIVKEIRNKGYKGHVTCGGITPTLSYPYILERVGNKIDSLVLGEGEEILRHLSERVALHQDWHDLAGIAYLENNVQVVNKPIETVDLDALPFASRDYLDYCLGKTNYATIMGSRGCYGLCTFCSNYAFESIRGGPRWRGRSPNLVIDEMQEIYETRGVTVFKFNDPNIFGPGKKGKEHVRGFCREVARRNLPLHLMGFCRGDDITKDPSIIDPLKKAGFERLLIGVESSDNETLQKFRKGETIEGMEQSINLLQDAGISTVIGFLIFNPYTTTETLKKDLAFLEKSGLTPTLSKALRVFDGTPIQHLMEKEGRLIEKNPFEGYHDYVMPKDVAAIYAAMKTLYANCLDKIRAVGQGNVWNIKKAPSFRDRQDFNNLLEAFFDTEAFLLKGLITWTENRNFTREDVSDVTNVLYRKLDNIGQALSVETRSVVSSPDRVANEIYTLMEEKPWNTFREEYRWNQD